MSAPPPRLFVNSYKPLAASKAGREASALCRLPPFIDGSIRREPDLEHPYPSISCLCRTDRFAPRLRVGDVVLYLTKKAKYGMPQRHRRVTAILQVAELFADHDTASAWYAARGLVLPSNCLVPGNPPHPVGLSHRQSAARREGDSDEAFTRRWDAGYQWRARKFGRFVICRPLQIMLGWDAPVLSDDDLRAVFGRVPATRNPGALDVRLLHPFTKLVGLNVTLADPTVALPGQGRAG